MASEINMRMAECVNPLQGSPLINLPIINPAKIEMIMLMNCIIDNALGTVNPSPCAPMPWANGDEAVFMLCSCGMNPTTTIEATRENMRTMT